MFRPFLPGGFAYGFAYGIPCSFSGGRHPAGLFVLYHIGAVLVNRFRQNFGGICLFPAPGGAPVSGGIAPALQARRALAAPCGGACFLCRLPTLPLAYFIAPYPPSPLPRRGRGRPRLFSCKGLRPLHPRGWMGHGTGFACGKPILAASNGTLAPAGGWEPGLQKAATAVHLYGRVYKCRKRFSAGVPGAKPPAK